MEAPNRADGFGPYFKRYTKTWQHAVATAALTAFGMLTFVDKPYFEGELLTEATLGPGLASEIESGEWSGEFLFRVSKREAAEEVKKALDGS